jgi:hypothetical protein
MKPRHVLVPLFLAAFASVVATQCSSSTDPVSTTTEKYLTTPLTYPMTSDRYAVQYSVDIDFNRHGQDGRDPNSH